MAVLERHPQLTPEDLRNLTGYAQPARQARWLETAGIRHHRRAVDGAVVVVWAAVETPASGTSANDVGGRSPARPKSKLNFDALRPSPRHLRGRG